MQGSTDNSMRSVARLLLVPAVAAEAVLRAHRGAVRAPLAARRGALHLVQHLLLQQHLPGQHSYSPVSPLKLAHASAKFGGMHELSACACKHFAALHMCELPAQCCSAATSVACGVAWQATDCKPSHPPIQVWVLPLLAVDVLFFVGNM